MWKETINRLDLFERLVQEGRALEPAVEFARFVLWSGLISFFEQNPQSAPLKCDGPLLRWKCEELQRCVTERYRLNDSSPRLGKGELETLHDKVDKLAGYVARLASRPVVTVTASQDGGPRARVARRGPALMLDKEWQERERIEDVGGAV